MVLSLSLACIKAMPPFGGNYRCQEIDEWDGHILYILQFFWHIAIAMAPTSSTHELKRWTRQEARAALSFSVHMSSIFGPCGMPWHQNTAEWGWFFIYLFSILPFISYNNNYIYIMMLSTSGLKIHCIFFFNLLGNNHLNFSSYIYTQDFYWVDIY